MDLVLASSSPRRAELLSAAGFAFRVVAVDVDERPLNGESPAACVERLALAKARSITCRDPGEIILAADTVVVVDAEILGKPADEADARAMLEMLSGREHQVLTGVALRTSGRELCDVASSRVRFLHLTPAEVAWYVASGEPRDKAGAYAIQGLASRFVEGIDGSYSNVVGLPVSLVYRMLKELGVD